ncbi:partial HTH-type transcriptional regulator GltC, partial [Methylacidimicrobium cyclopophantes]
LVAAYRRHYPHVDLQISHMNPAEQLRAFDEGRLDLGFSRPLPAARRAFFHEEILYRDYLSVALPPDHRLAGEKKIRLEALANESFIFLLRSESPTLFDLAIETCRRAGFSPKIVYQPDMIMTVFALIECNLGVSLLPRFSRGLAGQKTIRRPLAEPSNPICLCAIWPKSVHRPTLDAFLEIMRSQKPSLQKEIDRLVP